MRFSSFSDTEGMGEHARKQIAKALAGTSGKSLPSKKVNDIQNDKSTSPKAEVKKKKTQKRVLTDPITGLKFCEWPSPDPGVWLHELLNKHFGSFDEGGDHAHEVIIDASVNRERFDHLLFGILAIEFDGFAYHRHKDNFKKDRRKQKLALSRGFIVHRLSNEDVKSDYERLIPDIIEILSHFPKYNMELEKVGKTQCKFISRTPKN
tara:strand:+ start:663 stop:1283 length:621 start_codon:yes stop_codon:yes gene_type:complete